MAIEHVTFNLSHIFADNGYKIADGLPSRIPANVSMEIILTLWEAENEPLECDGANAVAKMYARPLESVIDDTLMATGSIGGGNNHVLTFEIPKNTWPDAWSLYSKVRVIWQVEDEAGNVLSKVYQDNLKILSFDDPSDIIYPYSEDIAISTYTYSVPTTLTDEVGWRVIYIDGTTVTLPDISSSENNQMLWVIGIGASGTNILNPNGATINGIAGNVDIPAYDGLLLFQDGSSGWYALNPDLTVP